MFQFARMTCVLALGAMLLPAQTATTNTLETTPMIGIATGQTARLNLLNAGVPASATAVICTATVMYLDASGAVLKTATVAVAPGTAAGVELHSASDLGLAAAQRKEIRATVGIPAVPPPTASNAVAPVCNLVHTLEIYDSITGRTQAVVGRAVAVQ